MAASTPGLHAAFLTMLIGLLIWPCPGAGQSAPPPNTPMVQVRLMDGQAVTQAELRAEGGTLRLTTGRTDNTLVRLAPGETATLGTRGNEVYLRREDGGLYAWSLRVLPEDGAQWSLAPKGEASHAYAGNLSITPDASNPEVLQLVNAVPLDEYVASVVASEYALDDVEGAKAMAVVARTYALRASDKFDGDYQHVDHTRSQVYGGLAAITPEARAAAHATRGEVLTYDGQLIEAVYFSSSGGHTANNEDVWDADTKQPYLRGKSDPYDTNSPHHRWKTTVSRPKLLDHFSQRFGVDIEGFHLVDHSLDGRVSTIELLVAEGPRRQIQANDFRLFVNEHMPDANLKSTWFKAWRSGNQYVFEGRGYGHGVGLSQWGAHAMAQQGHDHRDILTFYYTGVSIQTMSDVGVLTPIAQKPQNESRSTRRIGW